MNGPASPREHLSSVVGLFRFGVKVDAPTSGSFESSLRASFHERVNVLANESPSEPATPSEQPTPAAEPSTPSEPAAPAAPEPGSTPSPSEPVQAKPEGSTPPDQPAPPAPDAPTTSAVEALNKRGFKLTADQESFAKEYLRIESEYAATKRAEKEQAKAAQPVTQTAPEVPAVQPKPTTTARAPEPPTSGPVVLPPEVEQRIDQLVSSDHECRTLSQQFNLCNSERAGIYRVDDNGRAVGAFVEVSAQIADLERLLMPTDRLRALGLEVPQLDDLQRQQAETKLARLEIERNRLESRHAHLTQTEERLATAFSQRKQGYRSRFEQEILQNRAEAEFHAEVDTKAAAFQSNWSQAEAAAFNAHNVPESLRADVHQALKDAAAARLQLQGAIPLEELPQFIADVTKREMERADKYHRLQSAEYAKAKKADAATLTPGPTGAAAVAPPAPIDHKDWEKALLAKARGARKSLTA